MSGKVEQLQKDKTVVALQKIKWYGGFRWRSKKLWLKDQKKDCHFGQVKETYSEHIASGATYKIPSGAKGRIVSLKSCKGGLNALTVAWDIYYVAKVFEVFPEQVMQIPRVFQDFTAPTTTGIPTVAILTAAEAKKAEEAKSAEDTPRLCPDFGFRIDSDLCMCKVKGYICYMNQGGRKGCSQPNLRWFADSCQDCVCAPDV